VGEDGLVRELAEAGLAAYRVGDEVPPGVAAPAAVVVGMDRRFCYENLAAAQAAIGQGALFVATNRDATFPTPHGFLPGAGSIVAAVATAAQKEPVLMGKPGLALAEALAAVTGVPPAQTLFVGDRLSTDIAMGDAAGMVTVLVLTGVTSRADLEQAEAAGAVPLPQHVLPGLSGLPGLLDRLAP
jgi:4-nitrophenyl phosphatase